MSLREKVHSHFFVCFFSNFRFEKRVYAIYINLSPLLKMYRNPELPATILLIRNKNKVICSKTCKKKNF